MKLSTRTRYGTRALLDLAIHNQRSLPVPLKDIARRQEIPLNYLEHIIGPLVAADMIRTVRGVRGGIILAKPSREINLKEVVEALEGSTSPVECIADPKGCPRSAACATRELWETLRRSMDEVLLTTTLQDLVEKETVRQPPTDMYYI